MPSTTGVSYAPYEPHVQYYPRLVPEFPLEYSRQPFGIPYPPPDRLCGGDSFTVARVRNSPERVPLDMQQHRLFSAGANGLGECGRSMQCGEQTPMAVRLPLQAIEDVCCGDSHSLAALRCTQTQVWTLYGWGNNQKNQIGKARKEGGKKWECPPTKITFDGVDLRDVEKIQVSCGPFSSAAILTVRDRSPGQGTRAPSGTVPDANELAGRVEAEEEQAEEEGDEPSQAAPASEQPAAQ